MSGRVQVLEWRALVRGSLRGFCKVQFQSGLVFNQVAIHRAGSKEWAAPPSRPMLDADGVAMRDLIGKIRYTPIVAFMNHGTRASWSRQIIAALREAHPEAFDDHQENAA